MSAFDTASLLAQVRRLAYAPTSGSTGSADADLLAMADFELQACIVPMLRRTHEEYDVMVAPDVALLDSVESYAIPTRASVASLRDIWLVRSDGGYKYLPRLQVEDIPLMRGVTVSPSTSSEPSGFYLRGNNIIIWPKPSGPSASLRIHYLQRPSRLVPTTEVAVITSINTNTGVVAATGGMGTNFTSGGSYVFDLVKANPHFDIWATDKTAVVSGTNATFTASDLPSTLAVGDYIALAGQSAVPQIPLELQPLLAQRVAVKWLEARGDSVKLQLAAAKLAEIQELAFTSLAPRVDGKPKILSNRTWL